MRKIQNNFYNLIPYIDVLHTEIFSSWDDRVAKEYHSDLMSLFSELYSGKNWAMLADCREWGLNTPEAEKFMQGISMNSERSSALTHLAILTEKSELKKWQIGRQIQGDRKFVTEFFDNTKDAKDWLASLGYELIPV